MAKKTKGKTLYVFTCEDEVKDNGELSVLGYFDTQDEAVESAEEWHLDNNAGEDELKYTIFECKDIGTYEVQTKLVISKKKKVED